MEDDFNPVGTMTGMGLSPNDPLYDWGSNIRPSDLQRFIHDPEGFKQSMVEQGIPPPDHHYISTNQGLQPFGIIGDPSGGNTTRYDQALGYDTPTEPDVPPQGAPPVYAPGQQPSDIGRRIGDFLANPANPQYGRTGAAVPTQPQPAPPPQAQQPTPPAPMGPFPAGVGAYGPQPVGPSGAKPDQAVQQEEEAAAKDLEKAKEKKLQAATEGLSKFAQSLQGVKMPQRPPAPQVGTPGVRSPNNVTAPQFQNLLALVGGAAPSAQISPLMRLLGRG